ncbi:MAG: outer membrane protein assembly factor BamA [Rhodobacterales bacterium]|nr:outer membrane protein assembly factor BamA [Rhodobacterales bacterium]
MDQASGALGARGTAAVRLCRTATLSFFLATSSIYGPFSAQAQGQSYSFSSVIVEGNIHVDAASIMRFAGIGRGQTVSAGELNDAYQRVVNSGLFETVAIEPQGGTLVIRVSEYPVINVINFEGNKMLKDEDLAKVITSQSRRVYSPSQVEADAAAIAEGYRSAGRIAATVTPRLIRLSDNRVDLAFEITEGKVTEIERLSFVGNRAFSDRRLRQVLSTKQAGLLRTFIKRDTFVADRLEFDKQLLRDFYLSRGYVDFQVQDATGEIARERDAFFVTFTVQEGQSFRFGKITAVSELPEVDVTEFEALLRIRSGVTYNPSVVDNNIARLENLALRKGLTFVTVVPRVTRNERDQTLDIEFALTRGEKVFVERIDIQGNTTTLDQVVRRQFRSVEGDPFNPREIRQAAERIRALGFFSDAKVDAKPGTAPDQVIVGADVVEKPTGSLNFGATYGVSSGIGFTIGLTESNFLGRGQSIGVNVATGTDNVNSSISFVEPAFLGRDLTFSFSTYYNTTDNQNSAYGTLAWGINPAISFPISENGRLELRYRLGESKLRNVDTGTVDDPATPEDETSNGSSIILQAEQAMGPLLSSAVGYSYSYDTRTNGLNPRGGVLLRFSQDFAGLGGDIQSVTSSGLALAETRIMKEEVTLRAVLEGGVLNSLNGDVSRVTERFFANGKIRGFEPNGLGPRDLGADNRDALGGNMYAVARLESEFPLGLPEEYGISGGLFLDAGSVWSLDDAAGTGGPVDDSFHLRSSVGFSVFWTTPIGPLRFNFSRALNKQPYDREQTFDFTVSTSF